MQLKEGQEKERVSWNEDSPGTGRWQTRSPKKRNQSVLHLSSRCDMLSHEAEALQLRKELQHPMKRARPPVKMASRWPSVTGRRTGSGVSKLWIIFHCDRGRHILELCSTLLDPLQPAIYQEIWFRVRIVNSVAMLVSVLAH